jgi:hypothetical protein
MLGLGGTGISGGGNGGGGAYTSSGVDQPGGMGSAPTVSSSGYGPGGGGGGLGYTQIFTPFGVEPILMGVTSPLPQPNLKVDME